MECRVYDTLSHFAYEGTQVVHCQPAGLVARLKNGSAVTDDGSRLIFGWKEPPPSAFPYADFAVVGWAIAALGVLYLMGSNKK